jgi:hypothetical protein
LRDLAGDFPATFYSAAAPDHANLPLAEMYIAGTFCGVIAGIVLNAVLGSRKPSAGRIPIDPQEIG